MAKKKATKKTQEKAEPPKSFDPASSPAPPLPDSDTPYTSFRKERLATENLGEKLRCAFRAMGIPTANWEAILKPMSADHRERLAATIEEAPPVPKVEGQRLKKPLCPMWATRATEPAYRSIREEIKAEVKKKKRPAR